MRRAALLACVLATLASCRAGTFLELRLESASSFAVTSLSLTLTNAGVTEQVSPAVGGGFDLEGAHTLSLELTGAHAGDVDVVANVTGPTGAMETAESSIAIELGRTSDLTLVFAGAEHDLGGDGDDDSGAPLDLAPPVILRAPPSFFVGTSPSRVVSAHFVKASQVDVAVALAPSGANGAVAILLGAPTFTQSLITVPIAGTPLDLAAADFDGDGHVDLAVAYATATQAEVVVLHGAGNGSFTMEVPIAIGTASAVSLAAGLLNGDAYPDLAVAVDNGSCTVTLYLGQKAAPTLAASGSPTSLPGGCSSMVAGRFGADVHLDLAVAASQTNNVTELINDGSGGFTTTSFTTLGSGASLAVGDIDDDGDDDLAVVASAGLLQPFLSSPTGFTSPGVTSVAYGRVALVDLDGDHRLEAVVTDLPDGVVQVCANDGTGFASPVPFEAGAAPADLVAGDFDQDGHPDLILSNSTGASVTVLRGLGSDRLFTGKNYQAPAHATSAAMGHFGAHAGVVMTTGVTTTLLGGAGDGTLGAPQSLDAGTSIAQLTAADVDGDHYGDLVVIDNTAYNVAAFWGSSTGAFTGYAELTLPSRPSAVLVLGGGPNAIAVASVASANVAFVPATGRTVGPVTATLATNSDPPSFLASDDLDGNGQPDLVATAAVNVWVSLQNGGMMAPFVAYPHDPSPVTGTIITDADGDGKLDIVVADGAGLELLRGVGDGTFASAQRYTAVPMPLVAAGGVFQPMARGQLLVGDSDSFSILGYANGQPLQVLARYGLPDTHGASSWVVVVGDLDGDGLPDVVWPGADDAYTTVFLNVSP